MLTCRRWSRADPARSALAAPVDRRARRVRDETHRERPDVCVRRDVEAAMAAAAGVADGQPPSDAEIAASGVGAHRPEVRDTLYALAVGPRAPGTPSRCGRCCRALCPTPWRVEALVQLAFSAYARGDGPLAGVSLEAALRCEPGHRMAGMLDTALQSGLRPEQIRELAVTGYRLAERLGVRLPPRRSFRRRAV